MAVGKETSSSEVISNQQIGSGDSSHGGLENPSIPVTGHKLNGRNYLQWSQSVMMFLCGRGKDEYLTEEILIPEKNDLKFRTWKTENHMVMSWLINSMNNDVGEKFLLYGTAKEIWDAARKSTQVQIIHLNYFKLKQHYMTSVKEISPLLNTSTS